MKKDNETYGEGNAYDFGARIYDSRLGRWLSLDPLMKKYPYLSAYVYCNNIPVVYIDPDGKRFYFAAGAGNDPDKTGYPKMMLTAFSTAGIQNTVQISAHGKKENDILFTIGENSRTPANKQFDNVATKFSPPDEFGVRTPIEWREVQRPTDFRITKAANDIKADLKKKPLEQGEQFNLSGYSTGSVVMAQAALLLANEGHVIDNLVLIGTSISEDSQLWKELKANKNIKNIIREDIKGDNVEKVNKGGSKIMLLISFLTKKNDHPHFKFAFGKNAKKNSEKLGNDLKSKGVK